MLHSTPALPSTVAYGQRVRVKEWRREELRRDEWLWLYYVNGLRMSGCGCIDEWPADDWLRLYYVNGLHSQPGRSSSWGKVKMYDASEALNNDFNYWADSAEAERVHLEGFVQFLARLQPRSSRDEKPLNDLHRGLLVFLAEQLGSAAQDSADLYHAKEKRLKEKMAREMLELQQRLEAEIAALLRQNEIDDASRKRVQHALGRMNQGLRINLKTVADEKLMVALNAQQALQASHDNLAEEAKTLRAEREELEAEMAALREQLAASQAQVEAERKGKMQAEEKLLNKIESMLAMEAELDELRPKAALADRASTYFDQLKEAQSELDEIKRATRKRTAESLDAAKAQMNFLNREFEKSQEMVKEEAERQLKSLLDEQESFKGEVAKREAELQKMNGEAKAEAEKQLEAWRREKEATYEMTENVRLMQAAGDAASSSDGGATRMVQLHEQNAKFKGERKKALEKSAKMQGEMGALLAKAVELEDAVDRTSDLAEAQENQGREEMMEIMQMMVANSQNTENETQLEKETRKQLMTSAKDALIVQHRDAKFVVEKLEMENNPEDKIKLERARLHEQQLSELLENMNAMQEEIRVDETKLREEEEAASLLASELNAQVTKVQNQKKDAEKEEQQGDTSTDFEGPRGPSTNTEGAKSDFLLKMSQDAASEIQKVLVGRANGSQNTNQFKALGGGGGRGGGVQPEATGQPLATQEKKRYEAMLYEKDVEIKRAQAHIKKLEASMAIVKMTEQAHSEGATEMQKSLLQAQRNFRALADLAVSVVQLAERREKTDIEDASSALGMLKDEIMTKVTKSMEIFNPPAKKAQQMAINKDAKQPPPRWSKHTVSTGHEPAPPQEPRGPRGSREHDPVARGLRGSSQHDPGAYSNRPALKAAKGAGQTNGIVRTKQNTLDPAKMKRWRSLGKLIGDFSEDLLLARHRGVDRHIQLAGSVLRKSPSTSAVASLLVVMPTHAAAELMFQYTSNAKHTVYLLRTIHEIYPQFAAAILNDMPDDRRDVIFNMMSSNEVADLRAEMMMGVQASLLSGLSLDEQVDIVMNLDAVTGIQLLSSMQNYEQRKAILEALPLHYRKAFLDTVGSKVSHQTAAVFLDMASTQERMSALDEMDLDSRAQVLSQLSDFSAADCLKHMDFESQLALAGSVSKDVAESALQALQHDDPEMAQKLRDAMAGNRDQDGVGVEEGGAGDGEGVREASVATIRSNSEADNILASLMTRPSTVALINGVDRTDVALLSGQSLVERAKLSYKTVQSQMSRALATDEKINEAELMRMSMKAQEHINSVIENSQEIYHALMAVIFDLLRHVSSLCHNNNLLTANKGLVQQGTNISGTGGDVSEFLLNLLSKPNMDLVESQEHATRMQDQALQFIQEKYGLEGMVCELGYDPQFDDDGKDDPDTYDDNVFLVVSNTAGISDVKEGSYLAVDPSRVEYMAANCQKKASKGEFTSLPILLGKDCPLQTYGDVYGTFTVMGAAEKQEAAKKDLDFLHKKLGASARQQKHRTEEMRLESEVTAKNVQHYKDRVAHFLNHNNGSDFEADKVEEYTQKLEMAEAKYKQKLEQLEVSQKETWSALSNLDQIQDMALLECLKATAEAETLLLENSMRSMSALHDKISRAHVTFGKPELFAGEPKPQDGTPNTEASEPKADGGKPSSSGGYSEPASSPTPPAASPPLDLISSPRTGEPSIRTVNAIPVEVVDGLAVPIVTKDAFLNGNFGSSPAALHEEAALKAERTEPIFSSLSVSGSGIAGTGASAPSYQPWAPTVASQARGPTTSKSPGDLLGDLLDFPVMPAVHSQPVPQLQGAAPQSCRMPSKSVGGEKQLAEVQHNFKAEDRGEIDLTAGEFVVIRRITKEGWAEGERKGQVGWFPAGYLKFLPPSASS
ncbi:hypothetical protein CYMTET_47900 [Cymbomonas tetramitiformis]|uniref:SH3 domain-containing protein n=1 Tax=Cymbomonas tetramitiformis TaxID=36881 RepID=A0AAE0EVP1_9CHLO|nr:hypothetical protein CYMTET_47900 [Cymbomonas tetramitiformis]